MQTGDAEGKVNAGMGGLKMEIGSTMWLEQPFAAAASSVTLYCPTG